MFKRIGMPDKIESIDFDGPTSAEAKCPNCSHVLGRLSAGMLKPRGSSIIVVASAKQVCQKCSAEIEHV
jgi:hypothetical protein